MTKMPLPSGTVHDLPADFKKALLADPAARATWEDITPLARNEWICWIESAKKAETRQKRIAWGCELTRRQAPSLLLGGLPASLKTTTSAMHNCGRTFFTWQRGMESTMYVDCPMACGGAV